MTALSVVPLAARTRSMARRVSGADAAPQSMPVAGPSVSQTTTMPPPKLPAPVNVNSKPKASRIPTRRMGTRRTAAVATPAKSTRLPLSLSQPPSSLPPPPPIPIGSKRKADDELDARKKARCEPHDEVAPPSAAASQTTSSGPSTPGMDVDVDSITSTTPPHSPPPRTISPVTPTGRAIAPLPRTPTAQISGRGTPAREVLRAHFEGEGVPEAVPRPPTPPRVTQRTPENGYPPPSTKLVVNHVMKSPATRPPLPSTASPFYEPVRQPVFTPATATSEAMPVELVVPVIQITDTSLEEEGSVAVDGDSVMAESEVCEVGVAADQEAVAGPSDSVVVAQPEPVVTVQAVPTTAEPAVESMVVDQADSMGVDQPGVATQLAPEPPVATQPAAETTLAPLSTPPTLTDFTPTAPSDLVPAPMPLFEIPDTIVEAPEPGDTPLTTPAGPSRPPRPPTVLSALPVRRPSSRPLSHSTDATAAPTTEPTLKRKPSYPSSLGSGPLARPTARVVSNPLGMAATTASQEPTPAKTSRSVSEPSRPRSRMSLSMSTRHQDTTRNLAGLNDALARLRLPAEARTRRAPPAVLREEPPRALSASAPARMSNPNRTLGEKNQNTIGDMKGVTGTFFKGVVAYVDVYTAEGDDSGSTFAEMLRNGGARVLVKRPTEMCTHIIYKGGRPATASFVRKLPAERRPHVVGITWVTRGVAMRARQPEATYAVNLDTEDVFQPRRKSMEPKSLAQVPPKPLVKPLAYTVPSGISGGVGGGMRAALAPVYTTQRYAPKISSPLKKSSYVPYDDENSV